MLASVPAVPAWVLVVATIALMSPLTLISLEIAHYFEEQLSPDAWSKAMASGQRAFDKGDYPSAESHLLLALKSAKESTSAHAQARVIRALSVLHDLYAGELKYDDMRACRQKLNELKGSVQALDEGVVEQLKQDLDAALADTASKHDSEFWCKLLGRAKDVAQQFAACGKPEEGDEILQKALSVVQNALGPKDEAVGIAFHNLGTFYDLQHDAMRAQPYFAQSTELLSKAATVPEGVLARALLEQADFYRELQDVKACQKAARRAFALYEKTEPDGKNVADLHYMLGYLYTTNKMDLKAERELTEAASMYKTPKAASSLGVANCEMLKGLRAEQLGDVRQAFPHYKTALSIMESSEEDTDKSILAALRALSRLYARQGEYSRAEPLLRRAIAIQERTARTNPSDLAKDFDSLARLYEGMNQPDQARAIREEARLRLGSL